MGGRRSWTVGPGCLPRGRLPVGRPGKDYGRIFRGRTAGARRGERQGGIARIEIFMLWSRIVDAVRTRLRPASANFARDGSPLEETGSRT